MKTIGLKAHLKTRIYNSFVFKGIFSPVLGFYFSMTTFLRHVSTIYANLTALYSIGQSVQVGHFR